MRLHDQAGHIKANAGSVFLGRKMYPIISWRSSSGAAGARVFGNVELWPSVFISTNNRRHPSSQST
jgi:hypothetical protein